MKTENYMSQHGRWPQTGRHITAQYPVAGETVARHLGIDARPILEAKW